MSGLEDLLEQSSSGSSSLRSKRPMEWTPSISWELLDRKTLMNKSSSPVASEARFGSRLGSALCLSRLWCRALRTKWAKSQSDARELRRSFNVQLKRNRTSFAVLVVWVGLMIRLSQNWQAWGVITPGCRKFWRATWEKDYLRSSDLPQQAQTWFCWCGVNRPASEWLTTFVVHHQNHVWETFATFLTRSNNIRVAEVTDIKIT